MSSVEPEALAVACARVLDERKGEDILVLKLRDLTTITDYFVIATARNPRQLTAMFEEIRTAAGRLGIRPLGFEGTSESGWILVDLGTVVVHLFDPQRRCLYNLEVLWGDAPEQDWAAVPPIEGRRWQS